MENVFRKKLTRNSRNILANECMVSDFEGRVGVLEVCF